jgi:hypothetical protein
MSVRVRGMLAAMSRPWRLILAGWAVACAWASPAGADLVFLTSGRSLSVKSHRVDAGQIVLTLREGGEVVCSAALIARIEPDEVPYPDQSVEPVEGPVRLAAVPFSDLIEPLAAHHEVDVALIRAVIEVESAYRPAARSPKGAMGLMQLMPATARQYDVDDAYDPAQNLAAGIRHLRRLLDRYDVRLALAAYNAGEGAVARYGGIPPYRETRDYVDRVLRRAGLAAPAARDQSVSRPDRTRAKRAGAQS